MRLWGSLCSALGAHAVLAILFVPVAPAAVRTEPALQWIELAERAPALSAQGSLPPAGVSRLGVDTTGARRSAPPARRARAPEAAAAVPAAHDEVATEKQIASAPGAPAPADAPDAAQDVGRQRASESTRAGMGTGSAAPAGGVSDGTLATRAVLVPSSAACAGFFPAMAPSDDGIVTLSLHVAPSGGVHAARVIDERPLGEGFGNAARHCVRRVRFQPALDQRGHPVASQSVLRLRFARDPGARRRLTAALTR